MKNTLSIEFTVNYTPERRSIFMCQSAFAAIVLERAGMKGARPAVTPAVAGRTYTKTDCPTTDEQKAELAARGKTHSGAVSHGSGIPQLSLHHPRRPAFHQRQERQVRWESGGRASQVSGARAAIRRRRAALRHRIRVERGRPRAQFGPLCIEAWSDSSFADDVDTGRTTLGSVIKVNGATVCAASKLGTRVDSCVNHSELHAFDMAAGSRPTDGSNVSFSRTARNVTWIRGIKVPLEKRDVKKMSPTSIFVDNAGVLSMLEGNTVKPANRHIFRTLAENRETVHLDKVVVPIKVPTKENLANAMTKHCRKPAFEKARRSSAA